MLALVEVLLTLRNARRSATARTSRETPGSPRSAPGGTPPGWTSIGAAGNRRGRIRRWRKAAPSDTLRWQRSYFSSAAAHRPSPRHCATFRAYSPICSRHVLGAARPRNIRSRLRLDRRRVARPPRASLGRNAGPHRQTLRYRSLDKAHPPEEPLRQDGRQTAEGSGQAAAVHAACRRQASVNGSIAG